MMERIKLAIGGWIAESPSTRDPNLFAYMWKNYGLKKALGIGLYDDKFYAEHLYAESAYADLALVIRAALEPKSVCDFGCGNGFVIHYLKQGGIAVKGIEGSMQARRHAPAEVTEDIVIASVVEPLCFGKFDIVVSMEVAEHIPKSKANELVKNLAEHATNGIFFTAAAPGQWGDGHINCQPKSYWEALFVAHGWRVNENLQAKLLSGIREKPRIDRLIPWVSKNLMIFTPLSRRAGYVGPASKGHA
jgi:SAM-dependent methyltransferase